MSDSGTSHTKTATETATSLYSEDDNVSDRWTNNITYRQLVTSSCIGIMQLWWHPYVNDPRTYLPFLFLYNVFSIFLGYPLFYFEMALGVVSRKGVLKCWDLAPFARGVGWAMLATCVFTAFGLGIVCAYSLAMLVHSFHTFLPWLHCAATASPPCAARHRSLSWDSETPAQSFFHNYVLKLKRDGLDNGMGGVVTELTVYYVISWVVIYFIVIKKIYSYSKLVFFKDVLACFVIMCCVIGATQIDGARLMFSKCDWHVLVEDSNVWRRAVEYVLLEMTISQGSLIMLGTYCPKGHHKLTHTSMTAYLMSKLVTLGSALVLGATHGALHTDYGTTSNVTAVPAAYSLIMWSEFVARVPGSQFWSILVFFTLFLLSTSSVALLVQTMMSTFVGKTMRKVSWAFLVLICILFCVIGIFTLCTQSGIIILDFLMYWPISMPRLLTAAMITFVITYIYGQTVFCKDIYFTIGEYPNVFIRICWAIAIAFLMSVFVSSIGFWPSNGRTAGLCLNMVCVMPIFIGFLCYSLFRCRVRNIMGNEK